MVEKTAVMTELNNKSNFNPFARLATLPGIDYSCIEDFSFFGATKLAYDQLLEALQDDAMYRVGLYGMGGSGKTTLVNEVGRKAMESNMFDQVVAVTVSQTPNIRNIQAQMADMLKLEFKDESVQGRAQRLHMRLKVEKKILIIVDDIWGKFELRDIGIGFDSCHNGNCKVIMTTRNQRVCTLMDCQRKVLLGLLDEDEAWALFQKNAHMDDQSSLSLSSDVARDIAKECKGLPIAIQAVARSLRGQSIHEWNVALENLRSSKPVDVEDGERDAFSCLKLSYDHLKAEHKLLFLMCCIFPEDHDISIEELIRCGVGLGICGEYRSFDLARNQVMVGINKLVDSCLLMHSVIWWRKSLKMHDLIRDLGIWVAFKEGRSILVNMSNDLNLLIRDGAIKNHFAVSSWYRKTKQISTPLMAAKLEILWIETDCSLDLSSTTLEGLQSLKVMTLIVKYRRYMQCTLSLSSSIDSLTNLRTLCLRGWKLGDISFVDTLIKLEVLELKNCIFNKLRYDIGNLNKLKLLDLSECAILENHVANGDFSQIEELYVSGNYNESSYIHLSPSFVGNINATNLQRYVLDFRDRQSYDVLSPNNLILRTLRLPWINISSLSAPLKNLLQRANYVHLISLHGAYQNLIPNMVGTVGSMNNLVFLQIDSCSETEYVVDTTSDHVDVELPPLAKLYLGCMTNLKELCRGPLLLSFFEKLQELHLEICPQLHSIFPMECRLPNLRLLAIGEYMHLSGAISCSAAALFSLSVAQGLVQLEVLTIRNCVELKHIIMEKEDGDSTNTGEEIIPASESSHLILPNLMLLNVSHCPNLRYAIPISSVEDLEQLQYNVQLSVLGVSDGESQQKHLISKLENIYLEDLPELISIWKVPTAWQILSLQHLQELKVERCGKLKCIFSVVVSRSLPQLTYFTVHECMELEEIMEDSEELENLSTAHVCFPKLKKIQISYCRKLKSLFPIALARMLPQLSILHISYAEQLEVIFRKSSVEGTSNGQEIEVPNLEELRLIKLPNFFDIFLLKSHTVKMVVDECPKFTSIIEAIQAIPQHDLIEESQDFTTNNRRVINKEQKRNVMLGVKWMYLRHLKYLKCVAKEPNSVSFENLVCLRVSGCRKLKFIFRVGIIKSLCLPQLKYLHVENCEELKEIISEYRYPDDDQSNSQQSYFPKLFQIWIQRCGNLKSVFSISTAKHLPALEHMDIAKCSQLEQIFCLSSEANDGVVEEMDVVLPKLKLMTLKGLPSLTHIFGGSNQLHLPALQYFMVRDCPNFPSTRYGAVSSQSPFRFQDMDCHIRMESDGFNFEFPCLNYDSDTEKGATKDKRNIVPKYEYSITFLEEPWIPYFERFNPTPFMESGFRHNLDGDLIIEGTKIWDEAKVRRLYTRKAADVILSSQWLESNNHAAYFRYRCHVRNNWSRLTCINPKLDDHKLLRRHKFLWSRVLHDELPVNSHLKKVFKSEKYSTCFLCSQAPETVDHLFLRCTFIRSLWLISPWGFRAGHWSNLTMTQWFEFLSNHSLVAKFTGVSSKELMLYSSVMMDKVWDERNRLAHASDSSPPDILRVAKSISAAYFEMKSELLPVQEVVDDIICPDGWFKAYFDVVTTQEESWAAALLLNHEGKLIGARTRKLSTKSILQQEALALELAVELAYDAAPKSSICLEGGCERVISILHEYLNDKEDDAKVLYLKPILMDVCEKLGSMGDWEGKSICRNFNWVAYNAAKWAAFYNSEGDVLNSVPAIEVLSKMDFLFTFLTNDDDDHDHDSLLSNNDNENNDGLLRLKLKEVFTHDLSDEDDTKYNKGGHSGIKDDDDTGSDLSDDDTGSDLSYDDFLDDA